MSTLLLIFLVYIFYYFVLGHNEKGLCFDSPDRPHFEGLTANFFHASTDIFLYARIHIVHAHAVVTATSFTCMLEWRSGFEIESLLQDK